MTAKERDKEIKHWQDVIENLEKKADNKYFRIDGYKMSYKDIRQQVYYAESQIERIREEWRRARMNECNGNCKPTVMSYDKDCPIHGYI